KPNPAVLTIRLMAPGQLPSLPISLLAALMPLILLTVTAVGGLLPADAPPVIRKTIDFIGNPDIAMLISVLAAIWLLGLRRQRHMRDLMRSLEDAFKCIAPVLLIIAGAGAFMQVMTEGGVNTYIAKTLTATSISPLIAGWCVAALIRICTGSSTVAALTAVGLLLPLFQHSGTPPELMVLAVG